MSADIETVKIMVKVKVISPLLAIIINVMKLVRSDTEETKDHRILIDKQMTKEMGKATILSYLLRRRDRKGHKRAPS